MDEIIIRKFEWKDIKGVMEIKKEIFNDNWDEIAFMKQYEECPEGFIVAENANRKILGYAVCNNKGYLWSIAVTNNERKKGIGKHLINNLIKKLNLKQMFLHVRISNKNAIKFYEKLGFKKIQNLTRIYWDGEDGVQMELQLKDDENVLTKKSP